jgi:nitrile hydratase
MPILKAERVALALRAGSSARLADDVPPRYAEGEVVVARNVNIPGHTRVPRYVRGRQGTVVCDHGVFIFADAHAASGGRQPQHCYSVRFEARDLWGAGASAREAVYVDLWDDHLEPRP